MIKTVYRITDEEIRDWEKGEKKDMKRKIAAGVLAMTLLSGYIAGCGSHAKSGETGPG